MGSAKPGDFAPTLLNRAAGPAALRLELRARLRVPVVAAPMFLVSGPRMVIAACATGIIGALPSANARTAEIFESWLQQIISSRPGVPFAVNLIVHASNPRIAADLDLAVKYRAPIVITSVGPPGSVVPRVHAYGGAVFADVGSVLHAKRVIDAGVDGLVLLTAGAGGQAGWLNPFAFIAEIRRFYDGPVAVAGCISGGRELKALEILGADLGYMGTAFLASDESIAVAKHKEAVVNSAADDVLLTSIVTGIPGSFLRSGLAEAGLLDQLGKMPPPAKVDFTKWRNVWSAGQAVGHVSEITNVAAIVARIEKEYLAQSVGDGIGEDGVLAALNGEKNDDIL